MGFRSLLFSQCVLQSNAQDQFVVFLLSAFFENPILWFALYTLLIHVFWLNNIFFNLPFFLCPPKKESKKARQKIRHSSGPTSSAALHNIRISRLTSNLDGDFTFELLIDFSCSMNRSMLYFLTYAFAWPLSQLFSSACLFNLFTKYPCTYSIHFFQ